MQLTKINLFIFFSPFWLLYSIRLTCIFEVHIVTWSPDSFCESWKYRHKISTSLHFSSSRCISGLYKTENLDISGHNQSYISSVAHVNWWNITYFWTNQSARNATCFRTNQSARNITYFWTYQSVRSITCFRSNQNAHKIYFKKHNFNDTHLDRGCWIWIHDCYQE